MEIKEYIINGGKKNFKISKLKANYVSDKTYSSARDILVRTCHDIFLKVKIEDDQDGILLVKRKQNPAKGLLWCIGGGKKRGVPLEKSIKDIVKQECNLEIDGEIHLIDLGEFYFRTNPFGTKKGVDDFALVFYAVGRGKIKLNALHTDPIIITKENYRKIRRILHPYLSKNIDKIFSEYWQKS